MTPFHIGIGALAKGLAPNRVSFSAFAASQVVLDLEPAYFILTHQWPLHRAMHRLAVAVPIGLAVGAAVWAIGRLLRRALPEGWARSAELALRPAVMGGFIGGATHPLLDAVMHPDVVPFWPFIGGNPLLGVIGTGALHLACIVAGTLGVLLWLRRRWAAEAREVPQ